MDSGLWGDLWLSSTWPWGDQGRGDIASGVQKPEKEAGSGNGLRAGWSAHQWCAPREAVGFTWQLTSLPIAQIDKTFPTQMSVLYKLQKTFKIDEDCYEYGASLVAQSVKNLSVIHRDPGSIPGLGRSPGEGNGNPLQYSFLENSMEGEPGRLQSMGSQKSDTRVVYMK